MAMPALQRFREQNPDASIAMLVKPALGPLWAMHPAVDDVLFLGPGLRGIREASSRLRQETWDGAFVLPHSVRAALPPWLAGIPRRTGFQRSQACLLLSTRIRPRLDPKRAHQAFEYMDLLLPDSDEGDLPSPRIEVPEAERLEAQHCLPEKEAATRWVGIMPGAARGPSKRWPAGHFRALAQRLLGEDGIRIVLLGGPGEQALCEEVLRGLGTRAMSLAGRTSLPLWAALLEHCALTVCNDSGGMHLAAAVGTPLIALFGQTDPAVTGPLGPAEILQRSGTRGRDIARDSEEARKSLASIPPEEVYKTALRLLKG